LLPTIIYRAAGRVLDDVALDSLARVRVDLEALPAVAYANVIDVNVPQIGSSRRTVRVTIFMPRQTADEAEFARSACELVANGYPASSKRDSLNVSLAYGFDIGIASQWHRTNILRAAIRDGVAVCARRRSRQHDAPAYGCQSPAPFSCKKRGICPSCGARRMVETAAHLVDHVIPRVPVRQWVLSFPWPLRMLFAARPEALTRCLAVVIRSIETHLLQRVGPQRERDGTLRTP
jgi:hypothetical protein